MRYSLRTLLIVLALLPPLGAIGYRRWRDDGLWDAHSAAKHERDAALVSWRIAYEHLTNRPSAASAAEESKAQQQYYAARKVVEKTANAIRDRYRSEAELSQAIQARNKR
jgi:hypothetical protein